MSGGPVNAIANALESRMDDPPSVKASANSNPGKDSAFARQTNELMKALSWQGKQSVSMVNTKVPAVVDGKDAVIRITGTTVCGSDLHLLHGQVVELQKGDILGHEFMGIVDEVGPECTQTKVGDRVVASFQFACGDCYMCKRKLSTQCPNVSNSSVQAALYGNKLSGIAGYSHFVGGFAGGQAEYVRIPYADVNLLKIPDEVPDEKALYLSDVLITSYHCVVDTGVKKGDIVGIWGMGTVGMLTAKWCLLMGAARVIVIDNVQWRLDHIKSKLPEVETLNFDEVKDVAVTLNEMTGPRSKGVTDPTRPPGLDVALECAGGEYAKSWYHKVELAVGAEMDSSELVNEMISAVINFGRIGLTGDYVGFTNHLNLGAVMMKGVRLIGNGQAPVHKHWEKVLNEYLIPGKIDPVELVVTHRIPLEDVANCYYKFDQKKDHIIKCFVETRFSARAYEKSPPLTRITA